MSLFYLSRINTSSLYCNINLNKFSRILSEPQKLARITEIFLNQLTRKKPTNHFHLYSPYRRREPKPLSSHPKMDAAMNDGNHAARDAARDEVILNLQQQVQQLMANALNQQAQRAEAAP
ncbi:hypothetical protein PGT21_016402 [Puccinia graminis f. sp. tritici]|uniref:Uncharacterized protein n=1 Tax=Puccinia graminis f. sp. tritici TaxID=56615 RepID=A0A5B0QTK2_PUCGR|nr:hypothetical protein PGT21_016402 [Puccinia graminis f. sp. tritici]